MRLLFLLQCHHMAKIPFLISASLTDLPILTNLDSMFRAFKQTGVDGIEIVLGLRSRWSAEKLKQLSEKYSLPILSIHQPLWSGFGIYFDKHFLPFTQKLGVKRVVFHPLPISNFHTKRAQRYFQKLAFAQEQYGIQVMLENMSLQYMRTTLPLLPTPYQHLVSVFNVYEVAREYDFQLTFDTSHALSVNPHTHDWFETIYEKIGNIHLSSFSNEQVHLPLILGEFHSKDFISYLYKKHYTGLVTLEVYYPKYINLRRFDYQVIADSVSLIHSAK